MAPQPERSLRVISSPCTGICTLDEAAGHCLGCGRSLEEIAAWSMMNEARRQAIMRDLGDRLPPASLHAGRVPG